MLAAIPRCSATNAIAVQGEGFPKAPDAKVVVVLGPKAKGAAASGQFTAHRARY